MNILDKAKEIKKNISILSLAYRKKETPWYAKLAVFVTIAYALSPIDLIPDFIPVIGYLDDAIILPLLIMLSIKLVPKDILLQVKKELEATPIDKPQKKWFYGIPIIIFWLIIIALLIYKVLF